MMSVCSKIKRWAYSTNSAGIFIRFVKKLDLLEKSNIMSIIVGFLTNVGKMMVEFTDSDRYNNSNNSRIVSA